jgi:hypothetical protein
MSDWFDQGTSGIACDVLALLDSDATPLLLEMVAAGALISLGLTSDGGALAVTATVDGRWRREYFRETGELLVWLSEAVPAVTAAAKARSASSAPRSRQRGSRAR